MAIRRIYETPDAVLRQISKPVEVFDAELKTLVADMFETMYDAPGIGLAAVQVGEPIRLTQLAHGLPVGGELDYLDEGTLAQALRARRPVA